MLPERVVRYLKASIKGTPGVLQGLLGGFDAESTIWDTRFDEDRFTLREVLAHLADWDKIFVQRITLTLNEDNPTIPDIDEGELAVKGNYAEQDPIENLKRFAENRAQLVQLVDSLTSEQLERPAMRLTMGRMTVETQLVMIVAHDGYHMQQIVDFSDRSCEGKQV